MSEPRRILVAPSLPPLAATAHRAARLTLDLSRLRRLAACLVALALPVIGITAADTVHRVGTPEAMQAAAPRSPSAGAAAADGASRTAPVVREARLLPAP